VTGPPLVLSPLPTGGAALIAMYGAEQGAFAPPSGVVSMTLSRSAAGGPFTQIYAGPPLPYWVDVGDGPATSSQPLSAATAYVWQAVDSTGTTEVGPLTPAGSIATVPDALTQLLIRLLQAACDNALRPSGVKVDPAQVTTRMPTGGWQANPFVVVNLDLFQQRDTAVGQDVETPLADNQWTLPGWARRVWRISVFSPSADERDFYRDTILIAFRALKATLFSQIGSNIRHEYQATSGTTSDEWTGQGPGFFWADVMLDLEGVFDVTILTGFGLIERIDLTAEAATVGATGPVPVAVEVPLTKP
jgi:hypothetical protein